MALPGKLCIGIIEEDNPQKSYFRFKPLLIAEGDKYVPCDMTADYPEDGCIRIVPDKNESSRFKARMRRMGRYCMVDLRDHPDENDKIRPNKNYHGDETETNSYIIYSDVVRELPEGVLVEIVDQDIPADSAQLALTLPTPQTPRVIFSGFKPFGALWSHAPIANTEDGVAFTRTDSAVAEDTYDKFEIPGFGGQVLTFVAAAPEKKLYTVEAPAAPAPAPAAPAAAPVQTAAPVAPAAPTAPAAPAAPRAAAPAPAPAPAPAEPAARPWLHHDDSIVPQPVDPRLSPREQAIAMQTGINPRRGRSLHEIIEEKWRKSRFDQLGHPVPGSVTGNPVSTPIDSAFDAVKSAWAYINARDTLAKALAGIDGLSNAINFSEDKSAAEARAQQLDEYKNAREELAAEIERCKAERESLQGEMLKQLQEQHAAELEEHTRRITQLTADEEALRQRADDAKRIAYEAEQAIAQLTDEKLTARLSEYAVNSRAANLLIEMSRGGIKATAKPAAVEAANCPGIPALARRVRCHFAANGFAITEDEALNLLACLALGDKLLITGPAGCGKTYAAKLLTEALGYSDAGRCAKYAPVKGEEYKLPFDDDCCEYPAVIIADDINTACCSERIVDDFEDKADVKLIMTAQDSMSGKPIGLRLLDRAFTVRLKAEAADSHWGGPAKHAPAPAGCVTKAALKQLFAPEARHISAQVSARLAALRTELAGFGCSISRRTLDALWLYCASVTPYMSATPLEVFDLAFAQRALPAVIAGASPEALHALPNILKGMPRSLELLKQPMAIDI